MLESFPNRTYALKPYSNFMDLKNKLARNSLVNKDRNGIVIWLHRACQYVFIAISSNADLP